MPLSGAHPAEFVELLVRIAFARANPTFGAVQPRLSGGSSPGGPVGPGGAGGPGRPGGEPPLVPLPDCLHTLLHTVVLPRAKRDESQAFRERLLADQPMQAVLSLYDSRLRSWFDVHTQELYISGRPRALSCR